MDGRLEQTCSGSRDGRVWGVRLEDRKYKTLVWKKGKSSGATASCVSSSPWTLHAKGGYRGRVRGRSPPLIPEVKYET